jgi:hypothetical protein
MARKTWREKFDDPTPYAIKPAPISIAGMKAGEIMLIPTPRMIDAFVRDLPVGVAMDVKAMRRALAVAHGAQVTCPIYTGHHLRTIAEVACEAVAHGVPLGEVTPFWRVIGVETPLARKLRFGFRKRPTARGGN